jgi:hypothetical protein
LFFKGLFVFIERAYILLPKQYFFDYTHYIHAN